MNPDVAPMSVPTSRPSTPLAPNELVVTAQRALARTREFIIGCAFGVPEDAREDFSRALAVAAVSASYDFVFWTAKLSALLLERERLQKAVNSLNDIIVNGRTHDRRLQGKLEGVRLALSYLDESIRDATVNLENEYQKAAARSENISTEDA